ncbi:hypothetical protein PVMG_04567 [Plasmodium vivax Mauritania I]|uniref:Uncharacterized protein n=1 Tax=Plasmodium vivax Mauritania I TaxID=1035515 RepID=A0A0J9T526_PLAVI|nr:hypothetical protein PVMG_04567 [Plasmodium vivax Mauritania I]
MDNNNKILSILNDIYKFIIFIELNNSYTYDFLNDVWKKYYEFDKPVEDDKNIHLYKSVCNLIVTKPHENIDKQTNFCLKLVRNLGCYPLVVGNHYFDPKYDRCKILHYWIYNSVKNQQISNNLITDCFGDYEGHMSNIGRIPNCPYNPYENNYNEPMNMIILDIFQSNMETVRDIVAKENEITDFRVQKYICVCVKIYKAMYEEYCPNVYGHNKKRNGTCDMLNIFKSTYKSFLSSVQQKNYKIPSLDNVEAEYLSMCTQDNSRSKLTREGYGTVSAATSLNGGRDGDTDGMPSYEGAMNYTADDFTPTTEANVENHGSPMSSTVSTAVGTVAGASSVLALLYKVNKEFHLNV